jgi:hypothetical protein
MIDPTPTHQHYVPQFVLRNFASGRSKQIYVFDKATGKTFKTAVRNVASESGFYDFQVGEQAHSLDPLLTKVEEATKEILRKILQMRTLDWLGESDRATMALFTTVQMLRTTAQRNQFFDTNQQMRAAIERRGGDPDNFTGFQTLTEEEARIESIQMLPKLALDVAPHFIEKSWVLYRTPSQHTFYISDNPIALQNTMNQDPLRGTLGVAVPGIEIYFPISGTVCLGFLCASIEAMILDGHLKTRERGQPIPAFDKWIEPFKGRTPLDMERENVTNLNSLQVIQAERYVFSANGDFSLIREMLETHPELCHGPRLRVD